MKLSSLFAAAAIVVLPSVAFAQPAEQPAGKPIDCTPQGDVQFICTTAAAEDLALIPGTNWIITSGLTGTGGIRLINTRDRAVTTLFPSDDVKEQFDSKTYDDCPGPLDPEDKAKYFSQGNSLQTGKGGLYTLYSAHRGKRESIEVFQVDARDKARPPVLTWIGCAVAPNDWVRLNSVVGLPGGGLVATNFRAREGSAQYDESRKKLAAGENNGFLWEWHTGKGWIQVPGSEGSGVNGVEISKDGKWYYVDGYGNKTFYRLSRGVVPVRRDSVVVGFSIDNVKWLPGGKTLIAAGASQGGTKIIEIDPKSLKITEIMEQPNLKNFRGGSVAVPVGDTFWLGSPGSLAIPIVPRPK